LNTPRRRSSLAPLTGDARFDAALAAYHRADYDVALQLAEAVQPADAEVHLLRSQILSRVERADDAVDAARSAIALAHGERRDYACASLAGAQIVAGAINDAQATLASLGRDTAKWTPVTRGWIALMRALTAWSRGDLDRAETELIDAYADPSPVARARAQQIQAFIFGNRGQLLEEGQLLWHSLQTLSNAPDIGLRANIVHTLSIILREAPCVVDLSALRAEVDSFPWTVRLAAQRFFAHRCLGWRMVLEGGLSEAIGLNLVRRSRDYAQNDVQRLFALLDAAHVSFRLNEPVNASADFQAAEGLVRKIDWNQELGDERLALLAFADMLLPARISAASDVLQLYRSLPAMHPWMALAHDGRAQAMEAYVAGRLARYSGSQDEATDALSFAYDVFDRFHYQWRASLAAIELYELTGRSAWRECAITAIKPYPRSWVAARVGAIGLPADSRFRSLTPQERRIFELLLREELGRTDIARRLAVSARTVACHMTSIFRKFGVRSHRALLAEVRRGGTSAAMLDRMVGGGAH